MFEKLRTYYKVNIKPAIKNARENSKKNVTFLLAILVTQFLLCTTAMAIAQNRKLEREEVSRHYNYHLAIRDLNDEQRRTILNNERNFSLRAGSGEYKYVGEKKFYDGTKYTYDVFVKFEGGDLRDVYYAFIQNFTKELKNTDDRAEQLNRGEDFSIYYELSPLFYIDAEYDFGTVLVFIKAHLGNFVGEDEVVDIFGNKTQRIKLPPLGIDGNTISSNSFNFFIFNVLIVLFSVFLLMALYSERINHFKFDFGIYSVFGADTKKLIRMSVWEILFCDVILLIPAITFSVAILSLIYKSFVFYPFSVLKYSFLSVIIVFLAVYFPISALRTKTPISRLRASDNSNYVSSARRSFEVFQKKFPRKTSLVGLWRFRKYYARVMLITTAFSTVFVLGFYSAKLYTTHLSSDEPQFVINIGEKIYDYNIYKTKIFDPIHDLDGIKSINIDLSINANELVSHIIVPKNSVSNAGETFISTSKTNGDFATDRVKYIVGNKELFDNFKDYDYEGTLKVDGSSVVITNSINGEKRFDIKPGDKIKIARLKNISKTVAGVQSVHLLAEQIETFSYEYKEYTVSAVINDYSLKDGFALYMSQEDFLFHNSRLPALAANSFVRFNHEQLIEATADMSRIHQSIFMPKTYSVTDFSYALLDEKTAAYLKTLDHIGNIDDTLTDGKSIIVFKSQFIDESFEINVGDKIWLTQYRLANVLPKGLKEKELLDFILKNSNYSEDQYRVAAIINEDITDKFNLFGSCIFLNTDTFEKMTGRTFTYSKAEIYVDDDLKFTEIERLWFNIREKIEREGIIAKVVNTNARRTKELMTNSKYHSLIITLSSVMLVAGTIVCMFSQRLFYLRREKEFYILKTLGAVQKEIKNAHVFEGALLGAGMSVLYLIFGLLSCLGLYRMVNSSSELIFDFRMPIIPYLIGLVVVFATGMLSSILPYITYTRKGGGVNGNT